MSEGTSVAYEPSRVETIGRRLKMEYVGMASGFFVIFLLFLLAAAAAAPGSGWSASWLSQAWLFASPLRNALLAAAGLFALFIAIKKKTEDHLSASLLLMATTMVLRLDLKTPGSPLALVCIGLLMYAMEGAVEKRRNRIFVLPLVFWLWAQAHPTFLAGLAVLFLYLLPAPGREVNRRRIAAVGALCVIAPCIHPLNVGVYPAAARAIPWGASQVSHAARVGAVATGAAGLLLVASFGHMLLATHRANLVLTAALCFLTPSGLLLAPVVTVGLAATVFRRSIRFDALRPIFKHVEWYYFWVILLVAMVCLTELPRWIRLAGHGHHI